MGEHGGTASFERRGKELREKWGDSGPFERLEMGWLKEEGSWICVYKGDAGWVAVNGQSGEITQLEQKPEGLKAEREGRRRRRWHHEEDPASDDEKGQLPPLSVQEGVLTLGKGSDSQTFDSELPEGWVWRDEAKWSPTGEAFIAFNYPDIEERKVHYVRSSPADQLQPEHFVTIYPKPGDELKIEYPVVFDRQSGERVEFRSELLENPFSINRVHWRDESRVWLEYIERGFGKYRLIELNTETGESRIVASEESDKFIHVYDKCEWKDLGEGKLLWRSESSGWSHLYLIDEATGQREALTSGEWVVRDIERVSGEEIYFTLGGYFEDQDPYYLHFAKVNWKTGELTLLTEGDGTHNLRWSPDRSLYVDSWSRVDQPPVHELRRARDGSLITELGRADAEEMLENGFLMPERFVTKDRDGLHDIHGVIWKPVDFDPSRKYPVVENIYAGPHGAFVPKKWSSWYGHRSEMTAAGFVLVQIDGRGTNYRGRDFQHYAYKNLKDSGFPDRIKWITEAAEDRPWMDIERVGIYGGSAGGQSTLAGLIWHGDFYQAGVSDCGCHDNRMDKIWWNEQWMDWPIDESYEANANALHVERLQGKLLLTVGEVDTNVDPSSTYQVVDALIKADKDFEFFMVPNGGHGIGESAYLRRQRVEFFQRHLGEPR